MKRARSTMFSLGLAAILAIASGLIAEEPAAVGLSDQEPAEQAVPKETIRSLDISVDVHRTGIIDIEQDFVISLVEGGEIKRGPILSYLTVYRGLGNLVLDHRMEVTEVLREGKPEPFRVEDHGGITRIVCGSEDVFLEPGEHQYTIRLTRNGDWIFREGSAHWAYEITESFNAFAIERLRFELQLPPEVEFAYCTPALSGSKSKAGTGYSITETPGQFIFETTAPLRSDSIMFLNAGWASKSFATQSQWFEVMRQHPKLPLSGFAAIILLGSLIGLIVRIVKNHQVQAVTSA